MFILLLIRNKQNFNSQYQINNKKLNTIQTKVKDLNIFFLYLSFTGRINVISNKAVRGLNNNC